MRNQQTEFNERQFTSKRVDKENIGFDSAVSTFR